MLEKAQIRVLDGPYAGTIKVMFNPAEYTVAMSANTNEEGAGVRFQAVEVPDFTVSLFYDTYEKRSDVREATESLTRLILPAVEGKDVKLPPRCVFFWGRFSFKGIVVKTEQRFTMFLENGLPVRAVVSVTFKSLLSEAEKRKYTGREACRKLWTVKEGDRLDLISYQTLKDPGLWRQIAVANQIDRPLDFPGPADIGRILIVPTVGGEVIGHGTNGS